MSFLTAKESKEMIKKEKFKSTQNIKFAFIVCFASF